MNDPGFIPLSVPHLAGREWQYVRECLDTGWVSSAGSFVTRFEAELAEYVGGGHAVACVNGTAALHTALLLAGVRPGDLVLAPTLTFIAPINAIRYCGADPVFVGADRYYNLDPAAALAFLDQEGETRDDGFYHRPSGRRLGAVVPVCVFGHAGDWSALYARCRGLGLPVVEDTTEALGTRYTDGPWAGRHAGAAADLACFSFNGNKIITTGGGGMLVTADPELAARARYLTQQAKDDAIAYVHDAVGYNYRLTNLAAALGVAQLEQVEAFVARKQAIHARYRDQLADLAWGDVRATPPYARNNHWLTALYVQDGKWRGQLRALVAALAARRIETRPVWQLNHLQAPYRDCLRGDLGATLDLAANTLNLPSSVGLDDAAIDHVCEVLRDA